MPDEMDLVQGANQEHQQRALDEHYRNRNRGPGRSHCIDCEEPIPAARRKAVPNCTRCRDCQQLTEYSGGNR